jgi:hypothetical protein
MADANSNLNIVVKVRDEASQSLSRLSNDVSDLGGNLKFAGDKAGVLAGALIAAGSTAVLKSAINAFAESEAQMAKFDAIMKSLPPDLQKFRGEILETADKALLKFGFSNEDAALSMARLMQATHDGEFSMKAFQAAMGLAVMRGISLEDASQALILSFQGMPRLLKQYGIEVDDHASKETILAAVLGVTANQLDTYGATLKSNMEVGKQVVGEFSESLGSIFAPAIEQGIAWIRKFIEAHGGLKATIDLLQPVVIGLAAFLAGAFAYGIKLATASLLGFIGASTLVMASIFAIAGVLALFITLWQDDWAQAKAIFELFKINVEAIWLRITTYIRDTFTSAMNWIRDQLNGILSFFNSVVSTVSNPIQSAAKGISSTFSSAVGSLKGLLGLAEGGIVTRPTLAMVGEGGQPEAIIPLSRLGGMGGGGITINFNGDLFTTTEVAEKFGNELARIIKNQLNLAIRA